MRINLFKHYGIVESETVNAEDRKIELTADALTVKINLHEFPVCEKVCNLPSSFQWGMGANALTVIDTDGNNVPCGLIIRSVGNDMKSQINIREILIQLTASLYAAQGTIDKHSTLIDECLNFCKYPDIFKIKLN